MTRFIFILLHVLLLSCSNGNVESFPAHGSESIALLPVSIIGEKCFAPRLVYAATIGSSDTIVEFSFSYIKEHNGIVEWEEGTVKLPFSAIHCYAWPRVSYKDTERGGLP